MGILDSIQEIFTGSLTRGLNEVFRNLSKEVDYFIYSKLYEIKRIIFREILVLFVFLMSLLFLALSLIFFLIEYLNLSKTLSFLIIGIILLFIGIIIKITS